MELQTEVAGTGSQKSQSTLVGITVAWVILTFISWFSNLCNLAYGKNSTLDL